MAEIVDITPKSAVRTLIGMLQEAGLPAVWQDRAGGVMAIEITFGVSESHPYGVSEIVIGDREDMFTRSDYNSDDDVFGFFARAYRLDSDGAVVDDDDSEGWLWCTPEDAGTCQSHADDYPEEGLKVVYLPAQIHYVMGVVLEAVNDGAVKGIPLPRG